MRNTVADKVSTNGERASSGFLMIESSTGVMTTDGGAVVGV